MATTTPRLNLRKPAMDDLVNVLTDIGLNMDLVDQQWEAIPPTPSALGQAGSVGAVSVVARADHAHAGLQAAEPIDVGETNLEGVALTVARSDHRHRAPAAFLSHTEALVVGPGYWEDTDLYLPGPVAWARLTLRGRRARAGELPAHDHAGSGTPSGGAHGHVGSTTTDNAQSGNASVGHSHPGSTAANGGGVHNHGGGTGGAGGHGHTAGNDDTDHNHTIGNGTHNNHSLYVHDATSTAAQGVSGGTNHWIANAISGGDHNHGGLTGWKSGNHSHPVNPVADHGHTIGNADTTHGHSLSIAGDGIGHIHWTNHGHGVTVGPDGAHWHNVTVAAQGIGGTTNQSWPSTVSVRINGVDRTAALGGPWGIPNGDWNVQDLNVATYLNPEAWNRIEVGAASAGRLKAQVTARLS